MTFEFYCSNKKESEQNFTLQGVRSTFSSMTVSKKRDVTEKETKDSDKCRLVTLEGFPSFKRIPNSIRVHQREATMDEVDGRFDLKDDRKKKGDLFGSILKKVRSHKRSSEVEIVLSVLQSYGLCSPIYHSKMLFFGGC